jgi:predicted transcriptional regulator
MQTTTPTLPDELKERIAPLAEASGQTPHACTVDALRRQAALGELREAFLRDAAAAAVIDRGGPLYAADDVHAYLRPRAAGKCARRPGKASAESTP